MKKLVALLFISTALFAGDAEPAPAVVPVAPVVAPPLPVITSPVTVVAPVAPIVVPEKPLPLPAPVAPTAAPAAAPVAPVVPAVTNPPVAAPQDSIDLGTFFPTTLSGWVKEIFLSVMGCMLLWKWYMTNKDKITLAAIATEMITKGDKHLPSDTKTELNTSFSKIEGAAKFVDDVLAKNGMLEQSSYFKLPD